MHLAGYRLEVKLLVLSEHCRQSSRRIRLGLPIHPWFYRTFIKRYKTKVSNTITASWSWWIIHYSRVIHTSKLQAFVRHHPEYRSQFSTDCTTCDTHLENSAYDQRVEGRWWEVFCDFGWLSQRQQWMHAGACYSRRSLENLIPETLCTTSFTWRASRYVIPDIYWDEAPRIN